MQGFGSTPPRAPLSFYVPLSKTTHRHRDDLAAADAELHEQEKNRPVPARRLACLCRFKQLRNLIRRETAWKARMPSQPGSRNGPVQPARHDAAPGQEAQE